MLANAPILLHLILDELLGKRTGIFVLKDSVRLNEGLQFTLVFTGQGDAKRFVEAVNDVLLCMAGQNREYAKRENKQKTLGCDVLHDKLLFCSIYFFQGHGLADGA